MSVNVTPRNCTVVNRDRVMISAIKPHLYRGKITGHIAIQERAGGAIQTAYLTEDEALQLAYALLPDGYSINDPDG